MPLAPTYRAVTVHANAGGGATVATRGRGLAGSAIKQFAEVVVEFESNRHASQVALVGTWEIYNNTFPTRYGHLSERVCNCVYARVRACVRACVCAHI